VKPTVDGPGGRRLGHINGGEKIVILFDAKHPHVAHSIREPWQFAGESLSRKHASRCA
jgi:hypothetical protein